MEPSDPPLAAAEITLDPWKRLRALTDVVQEQQKQAEHLDRKVRFALIVMGLLNGTVVLGLRDDWPLDGAGRRLHRLDGAAVIGPPSPAATSPALRRRARPGHRPGGRRW